MRLLGRDLVLYRGDDGRAVALDAYCPHMGAHLAEGRVDGNELRCFFHDWKFDCTGTCVEVPRTGQAAARRHDRVADGRALRDDLGVDRRRAPASCPTSPSSRTSRCDVLLGNRFVKNCHPNVVLINAIDENHFNSVHDLPVELHMKTVAINENVQTFSNTTHVPDSNPVHARLGPLLRGAAHLQHVLPLRRHRHRHRRARPACTSTSCSRSA